MGYSLLEAPMAPL